MLATIKPARSGLILRDPADGYSLVQDAGKQIEFSLYWQRRIDDGDAEIVDESSAATTSNSTTESATTTAATGGAS